MRVIFCPVVGALARNRESAGPVAVARTPEKQQEFGYPGTMDAIIKTAIPVLPAADTAESLSWWTEKCGFQETFRDATPPSYAGISRGGASLHLAGAGEKELARKLGEQTMVRIVVQGIEAMYAEYQKRGGRVHPHGALETKPWGTREFAAIDPNGVCVTFQE